MNDERDEYRDRVREVVTELAERARLALSHEEYEEALERAERTLLLVMADAVGRAGALAPPGTWERRDMQGHRVGYVRQVGDDAWQAWRYGEGLRGLFRDPVAAMVALQGP